MAKQAAGFLSRRPLRSSRPVMGKQGSTQQTPGGRTAPGDKPDRKAQRAEKTDAQWLCPGCKAPNWTTRQVCRSCQEARSQELPQKPPPLRSANGANKAAPPTSYAAAVKGESTAPKNQNKDKTKDSGGGLLILGEALGADDEEAQVLGAPPFVRAHLPKIANLISQDCLKIQHLPEHLVAQEAGMQLGFALLQRTLPSRILHRLRGQAADHTTELCESLTAQLRTTLRSWLGHPALNATHWNRAHLPITAGGPGLPDLQAVALAARTAAWPPWSFGSVQGRVAN